MVKPAQKREVVDYMVSDHDYSIRQACCKVNLSESSYYYKPLPRDDRPLINELNKLALAYPDYGFPLMSRTIRNNGFEWNKKRIYRVYKEIGLDLVRKSKKRLPSRDRKPLIVPESYNEVWSMDFMSDALFNGRKFRTLIL